MTDPCAVVCSACGSAHHIDAAGTRDERGHCRECYAFLPSPTDEQHRLFGKRLEQTALHEDGYVTVGGYVEGAHGGTEGK